LLVDVHRLRPLHPELVHLHALPEEEVQDEHEEPAVEQRPQPDHDVGDWRREIGLQLFLSNREDIRHGTVTPSGTASAAATASTSSVVKDRKTSSRLMRMGRSSSRPHPLPTTARARSRRISRPTSLSTS